MADEQIVDTKVISDDDKPVTEDDLRDLKYGNQDVEVADAIDETPETEEVEEEPEETEGEIGKTDDTEGEEKPEPTFTKEFPNIKGDTPEEYAKNLEIAYQNSTAEAMRLKQQPPPDTSVDKPDDSTTTTPDITSLYAKQQMDKEINEAWGKFTKQYSQTTDKTEYAKFTQTVSQLSNTIYESEDRLASPDELYRKAAVILDWTPEAPTPEDKLKMAVKDGAASTKSSNVAKPTQKSKVTDAMLAANRKMYPGKSDAEIREELEPYL